MLLPCKSKQNKNTSHVRISYPDPNVRTQPDRIAYILAPSTFPCNKAIKDSYVLESSGTVESIHS